MSPQEELIGFLKAVCVAGKILNFREIIYSIETTGEHVIFNDANVDVAISLLQASENSIAVDGITPMEYIFLPSSIISVFRKDNKFIVKEGLSGGKLRVTEIVCLQPGIT